METSRQRYFIPAQQQHVYLLWWDGCVKIWENKQGPLDIPENFGITLKMNVLGDDDREGSINLDEPLIIQKNRFPRGQGRRNTRKPRNIPRKVVSNHTSFIKTIPSKEMPNICKRFRQNYSNLKTKHTFQTS
ncbi:ADM_collapsed_G0048080.mRNA.1.CDS.1 [Saccharomyces cerevisiae]|nr:ADM_collapsed_G0048080.mRNA.1.CDS.1 [Saccharomyces cerevisiae]